MVEATVTLTAEGSFYCKGKRPQGANNARRNWVRIRDDNDK